jgi:hypothetical protein
MTDKYDWTYATYLDTIPELIFRSLKSDTNHINTVKCKKIFYVTHVQSEQIPIIYKLYFIYSRRNSTNKLQHIFSSIPMR